MLSSTQNDFFKKLWMPIVLMSLCLLVYWRTFFFGFVGFDDFWALKNNPGLYKWDSWAFFPWAFTTFTLGDWQPLSWISLFINYRIHGLAPEGYHVGNVLLHMANGLLLFGVMSKMTASRNIAFVIAALFLVHPQHVESVAWISERKDVLSAFFWLLTMWSYLAYATPRRARSVERGEERRAGSGVVWYLIALSFFALGLMSKPTLVTLPFVLLLLDFWPLKRTVEWKKCLIEKIPFLVLIVFSIAMTLLAVRDPSSQAIKSADLYPLSMRILNAILSYTNYLVKTVLPYPLHLVYPYPENISLAKALLSGAFLLSLTAWVLLHVRSRPHLFVGWFWFLGVLVPMIGLIQAGSQSMADRYMYIPHMGLFMAVACELRYPLMRLKISLRIILITLILLFYAFLGWQQTGVWKDSKTLYEHALKYNPRNYDIQEALCDHHYDLKEYDIALEYCRKANAINPGGALVYWDFGRIYLKKKRFDQAQRSFEQYLDIVLRRRFEGDPSAEKEVKARKREMILLIKALKRESRSSQNYLNLGIFWAKNQFYILATEAFLQSVALDTKNVTALTNLANVYFLQGKHQSAERYYRAALTVDETNANAHFNYGLFLVHQHDAKGANREYEALERTGPESDSMKSQLKAAIEKEGLSR